MSVYLSTAASQLKATLPSALTIGANGQYIVSFCARIRTQIDDFGMLVALVDQDPNSTISRRVFSDDDTPYDTVSGDAGPGGAAGSYQCVTDTWYGFVLYRNTSGTSSLKIYPDSTSTTQLNSGANSGDTTALSGLDTVLIGDIEPSARRACVMEIANLKIQTGIDVWDDARCRYELDHFAFQSADGTERYAWELEDIDADSHGLNERGGAGPNFSVIAGTVAASANRPSQLEAQGGGGTIGVDDGDGPVAMVVQGSARQVRLF